ncbi:hypothetical protein FM112_08560 [Gulosibacter sp. 10]|nr:hypothetical protein FM112_08560 [Gulosibacter sp. 10]
MLSGIGHAGFLRLVRHRAGKDADDGVGPATFITTLRTFRGDEFSVVRTLRQESAPAVHGTTIPTGFGGGRPRRFSGRP